MTRSATAGGNRQQDDQVARLSGRRAAPSASSVWIGASLLARRRFGLAEFRHLFCRDGLILQLPRAYEGLQALFGQTCRRSASLRFISRDLAGAGRWHLPGPAPSRSRVCPPPRWLEQGRWRPCWRAAREQALRHHHSGVGTACGGLFTAGQEPSPWVPPGSAPPRRRCIQPPAGLAGQGLRHRKQAT